MTQLLKKIIYLFALSLETNDKTGQSVQMIHKIATDIINDSGEILKDFWLEWKPYNSGLEQQNQDMLNALTIGPSYAQCLGNETIISPIVAGPTWGQSIRQTHEVFDFYDMLHIGSCATQVTLTEKSSFFRTISTDKEQASIILKLCDHFNWKKVGFVYLDPAEGLYNDWLKEAVQESNSTVQIQSIPYKNNKKSMEEVAAFIMDNKLFVTVLYVRGDHLLSLFIELEKLGAASYPYFYITGEISWFDRGFIAGYNLTKYVNNLLGIVPGSPSMFNETIYKQMNDDDDNGADIWQRSNELMDNITYRWNNLYQTEKLIFPVDILNNYIASAFDSIMAIALALDELLKLYSSFVFDAKTTKKLMREILINNVKFNGASGRVQFDENGDRKHGIMAIVNIVDGVPVAVGGLFGDNFYIDENMIKWPLCFIEHGIVPQSFVDTNSISYLLYSLLFSLIISMSINVICIVIWLQNKRNTRHGQIEMSMTEQEDSSNTSQSFSNSHLNEEEQAERCGFNDIISCKKKKTNTTTVTAEEQDMTVSVLVHGFRGSPSSASYSS